jgi:uncharacterized protein (TIGR03905 family)
LLVLAKKEYFIMTTFKMNGTCARQLTFDVDKNNKITTLNYEGGCSGNNKAVSQLVIGKTPEEVSKLLKGIMCRNGTSCADQLARALDEYSAK